MRILLSHHYLNRQNAQNCCELLKTLAGIGNLCCEYDAVGEKLSNSDEIVANIVAEHQTRIVLSHYFVTNIECLTDGFRIRI